MRTTPIPNAQSEAVTSRMIVFLPIPAPVRRLNRRQNSTIPPQEEDASMECSRPPPLRRRTPPMSTASDLRLGRVAHPRRRRAARRASPGQNADPSSLQPAVVSGRKRTIDSVSRVLCGNALQPGGGSEHLAHRDRLVIVAAWWSTGVRSGGCQRRGSARPPRATSRRDHQGHPGHPDQLQRRPRTPPRRRHRHTARDKAGRRHRPPRAGSHGCPARRSGRAP